MLGVARRISGYARILLPAFFLVNCSWVLRIDASVKKTEEHTKKIKVEKQVHFYARNSRGTTRIVGKDRSDIFIKAVKKVKARDYEAAEMLMDELTFDIKKGEDGISLITRYPNKRVKGNGFWSIISGARSRATLNYYIEVPKEMEMEVHSASGDIEVTGTKSSVKANTSSGDIRLRNIGGDAIIDLSSGDAKLNGIGGDLDISTASGDIEISDVKGELRAQGSSGDIDAASIGEGAWLSLVSGDIELRGCGGDVVVKTSSGDIKLIDIGGSITGGAASGDVDVTISPVRNNQYIITTASGDVEVDYFTLPQYGFSLDVTTASGTISGKMTIEIEKVSRRHLKGKVGSGKALLKIVTASGDIDIREARGE